MLNNMRLGTKLVVLFALVGMIPLGVTSIINVQKSKSALQSNVEAQLRYVGSVKRDQVQDFFQSKLTELAVLPKTADVVIAYRALNAYAEDWDIGPSDPYDVSTSDYEEIYRSKCQVFAEYMREYGYPDIYLIQGEGGHVMYSGRKGKDLGTNLSSGPYSSSALARLWQRVRENKATWLTDIESYAPQEGAAAMFAGGPILDANANVIGVVATQVPLNKVDRILQNREGLGETGQAYLVGQDRLMRSNVSLSGSRTVLTQEIAKETVGDALAGESGVHIVDDFRGATVLSAYAPIRLGAHEWATITEMETGEVFAAVGTIQISALMAAIVLSGVVILVGLLTARKISRPIVKVSELTDQMNSEFEQFAMIVDAIADNDLTQSVEQSKIRRIKSTANDEIGILLRAVDGTLDAKDSVAVSMDKMISNLNDMVKQIQQNAEEIVSAAGEVASSSELIADGSQDQTNMVTQVSTAIEEMAATIVESSRNASDASMASEKASATATSGGEIVGDTVGGMIKINEVVEQSARSIGQLATSAEQIGAIITVINDIADQTNLLALNAAIEAARAGDQGRGFAVVADEVRKLAERTGKATGEIGNMIGSIQNGTDEAVKSMEAGTMEVTKGQQLADRAGQALSEIVDMSQEVVNMVSMIATASEEQSVAAGEISKNVEGFTESIKKAATEASVAAGAAANLNRLADGLRNSVSKFTLA